MATENLKIKAKDGSALVEGKFDLHASGSLARFLHTGEQGDLIGVMLKRHNSQSAGIRLFKTWKEGNDGLFATAAPAISADFGAAMPSLLGLTSQMWSGRSQKVKLHVACADLGAYPLVVTFKPVGLQDVINAHSMVEKIELEVANLDTGFSIKLRGPLVPFSIEKDGPLVEDAWLDCELVLPPAYCNVAPVGFYGSHGRFAEGASGSVWRAATRLAFSALGPGFVDWGQKRSQPGYQGPFVQAHLFEDELNFRPARRLWRSSDGLSNAETQTDGPEVKLGFGRSLIAKLLKHQDQVEVSFPSGIGHIDGQTGRSVGECGGPMTQRIKRLDISMVRRPTELQIEGEGVLEPLASDPESVATSLGPRLRFSFSLQRTWLLARGIELPRFWDDWERDSAAEGYSER